MIRNIKILVMCSVIVSLDMLCSDKKFNDLSDAMLAFAREHARLIDLTGIDVPKYITMTNDSISQMINSNTSSSSVNIEALKAVQAFENANPIVKEIKKRLQENPTIVNDIISEQKRKDLQERVKAMRAQLRR